jgi:MFS superfamily sulfate permease-like transporter
MVGFKLGIGTIIALNQLNFALGLNPDDFPDWESHPHFYERVYESLKHAHHCKLWNPVIFVLNMFPLIYLVKYAPPKVRLFPWHIIFVGLGVIYGYVLDANGNPMELLLLQDRFEINPYLIGTSSDLAANNPAFFTAVDDPNFSWGGVIGASFSVAVIAIIETQIACKILDGATKTAFDSKREVLGTGVCNFFTGLAGGLPVCGAMARMTLNANCGARSRTSIVINGFTVLTIMFALMSFFRYVPQPVIGAVLVPVAMGMVKIDVYRHYWRVDKPSLLITFITWAVCVFVDPTYAILVAILMGLLRSARNEGHVAPARWAPLKAPGSSVQLYQPAGKWDYTNIITHKQRIDQARKHGETVAVCMHDVYLMDTDGVDVLKAIVASGVAIVGLSDAPRAQCAKNDWFDKALKDGLVLDDVDALPAKYQTPENSFERKRREQASPSVTAESVDEESHSAEVTVEVRDEADDEVEHFQASMREEAASPVRDHRMEADITMEDVLAAQDAWAQAITTITRTYLDGGDYVNAAASAAAKLYGYEHSKVLFKPTKASEHSFRRTSESALSYFVGGRAVENGHEEDAGFAINGGQGWSKVVFENDQLDMHGSMAFAMGTYFFTCASTGSVDKVEYTFGYRKSATGNVFIFLHHSSLPYAAPPKAEVAQSEPEPAVVRMEAFPVMDRSMDRR